jgi:tartrate-resistant acid phosphatase type 5
LRKHRFIFRNILFELLLVGLMACAPVAAPTAIPLPSLTVPPAVVSTILLSPTPPTPSPTNSISPSFSETFTPPPYSLPTPTVSATPQAIVFAVIGDYGGGGQPETDVADLVKGWNPDFIVTTGDNNYPSGAYQTIDQNVGQFYQNFIYPYQGKYGDGATQNSFFPTLGNHDWDTASAQPYLDYFSLPGNERYYDLVWGPLHLYFIDSDSREPDGVSSTSIQANWLQAKLAASTSPWDIVIFHHAPYSSGRHGSVDWMQWPFGLWGADFVLAGHDHTYERIAWDGIIYFVNGLGGGSKYDFHDIVPGSQLRYRDDYGAMRVEVSDESIDFQFINRANKPIDDYQAEKPY